MADLFEELTNPFTGLPGADHAALRDIVGRLRAARTVVDRWDEQDHPAEDRATRAFRMWGALEYVLDAVPEWMLRPDARPERDGVR